jgi:TRAP-type C4-dicarboxylate transport system substrate-binding protein
MSVVGFALVLDGDVSSFTRSVLTEMQAKGLAVNAISPAERARMREAVKPVIEKFTAVVGPDLVNQAYAEIERVRKQR